MSSTGTQPTSPGWYPDPAGGGRLRFHDGLGWTAQVSHGRPTKPLSQGFAHLGDWLSRLLALNAGLCLLLAGYAVWGRALASRVIVAPGLNLTVDPPQIPPDVQADLQTFLKVGFVLLVLSSLVGLLCGVLWLVWQYKLAVSAPTALRRSPGMHVASWIIPFVSYWFPFQNVSDLWRSYGTGRQEEQAEAAPILLPLWWASFVVVPFVSVLGGFLVGASLSPVAPEQMLPRLALVYAVVFAMLAGSALLARQVVQRLSWRALVHYAGDA